MCIEPISTTPSLPIAARSPSDCFDAAIEALVTLDEEGFITIRGRAKRFAKIAGEMISLAAVEAAIARLLDKPECEAVVTALADPQKGEKLVVLCDFAVDEEALQRGLQQQGLPPLAIPSIWLQLDLLPKLGSGKTDYAGARTLAAERLGS